MTATTSYKWAAVNENWAPLSGVEVEALNLTTLKPDDVQRTGLDGIVTFTGLPAGPHIPRVRARRVSTKVGGRTYTGQVRLIPVAMGNQGITKHYVVDANGMGTHETLQAAVTAAIALGSGFEVVIYCNPGTLTEDITVPFGATAGAIYLVGEGSVKNLDSGTYNSIVTLQGSAGLTTPVLEATGTGSLSVVGIDFKPKLGASAETIKMATGNDLELNECKVTSWARAFTAVIDVRCRNCVISTGGRIIDTVNQAYFEHCYLSGAGFIKGNWDTLVINDCILLGTAPAGEYWIEEDTLVISTGLYVTKCIGSAGGGGGFIKYGDPSAVSNDCIIAHNKITLGAGEKGIYLVELTGANVTDNVIEGASNADGSTAIEIAASAACRGCVIAHNSIRTIQNGVVVGASGTDGSCVIGPNAFYDVGTATSGVPAAEDYQVSLATASCALLDGTIHTDTVAQGVTAGSIIIGNDTPAWDELAIAIPASNVRNVLGIDNGETTPSWKTALDGTSPANIANTASAGTSLVFAHRDHVHAHPAGLTATLHHTKYTGAEAIAAIEGEATLALDGQITEIHGDANFTLSIVSSNPRLTVDSGDYLEYNRASNYFEVNRYFKAPYLSLGTSLGAKVKTYDGGAVYYALGVQANVFELITTAASADFRWGYGTSGSLTEVMFLDSGTGTLKVALIAELAADAGVTIEGTKLLDSFLQLAEITTPANPDDGYGRLYMKNDDKLYFLSTGGTEYDLTGGAGDAADITYTPTTAADWDGGADPGDVDEALDELAERATDLEERGVYEYASSTSAVFGGDGIDPVCGPLFGGTPFIGTVNGSPTSTTVVYNHTSGENSLMRGMVLHNTTKGEKVYIEDAVIGTNTITVEANSPDDASTWDNTDALTTASQTNTGRTATFVDIDVTPHVSSVPKACILTGYTALQAADTWFLITHPYEAYDLDKEHTVIKHWQTDTMYNQVIIPLVAEGGRYYFTLNLLGLAGANAYVLFRWAGQFSSLVA